MIDCPECGHSIPTSKIEVGSLLYGFCEGFFGRDSYETKTVIAVGPDYVVVREHDFCGNPTKLIQVFQDHDGWTKEYLEKFLTPENRDW